MKISAKQYAEALYDLAQNKSEQDLEAVFKGFLAALISNNDLAKAPIVLAEFSNLWDNKKGIILAEVISSEALSQEIFIKVKDFIINLTKAKEVKIANQVDPNILGGIIIKYKDKILDGSLKTGLLGLKQEILA